MKEKDDVLLKKNKVLPISSKILDTDDSKNTRTENNNKIEKEKSQKPEKNKELFEK